MPAPAHSPSQRHLASAVRQQFVEGLCAGIAGVDQAIADFLAELMAQTGTQRDMQERRDAWSTYQKHHAAWVQGLTKAWKASLAPALAAPRKNTLDNLEFSLLSDDVVENKIIASRIALVVMEQVSLVFDALRLRMQALDGELASTDILRPDPICLAVVEQWVQAELPRPDLQLSLDTLQRSLAQLLQETYQKCNDFLAAQGVAAQQDLRVRVQRPQGQGQGQGPSHAHAAAGQPPHSHAGDLVSQALEQSQAAMAAGHSGYLPSGYAAPLSQGGALYPLHPSSAMTPLARARQRAHGVMGQLRRFLVQPTQHPQHPLQPSASPYAIHAVAAAPASSALAHALAEHQVQAVSHYSTMGAVVDHYSQASVVQVSGVVRQQSEQLKKTASTDSEKAIIEVVALMFQSILAEDHIPPSVRVWFARLQVPVLRVALAEPEFFRTLAHHTRQLHHCRWAVVFDKCAQRAVVGFGLYPVRG